MADKTTFRYKLLDLLNRNEAKGVDIAPLIKQHIRQNNDEDGVVRLHIKAVINELKHDKLINCDSSEYVYLSMSQYGEYYEIKDVWASITTLGISFFKTNYYRKRIVSQVIEHPLISSIIGGLILLVLSVLLHLMGLL